MYEFFFESTVSEMSIAIYVLSAMCIVLAVKVMKLEREHKKHRDIILYISERLLKLEDEEVNQ